MNKVKTHFKPVENSTDAKEWAIRFLLVHYLDEGFRNSPAQIEQMFEIAFNAARKDVKVS